MLERWKERFGREATFFKLVEVFLRADRRDLAENVCEFFKQNCKKTLFHQLSTILTSRKTFINVNYYVRMRIYIAQSLP